MNLRLLVSVLCACKLSNDFSPMLIYVYNIDWGTQFVLFFTWLQPNRPFPTIACIQGSCQARTILSSSAVIPIMLLSPETLFPYWVPFKCWIDFVVIMWNSVESQVLVELQLETWENEGMTRHCLNQCRQRQAIHWTDVGHVVKYHIRADNRLVPSQWGTSLQSNAVSHLLGPKLESTLSYDITRGQWA